MMDRRKFLQLGGLAGAGMMVPWSPAEARAAGVARMAGAAGLTPKLTPFLDPLPIPQAYTTPTVMSNGMTGFEMKLSQFTQQMHSQLPLPTPVWGYNNAYPGPTIVADQNAPVTVWWRNQLPPTHLLPVDTVNVNGGTTGWASTVRIATHLHGAEVPWESDGHMEGWYGPEAQDALGAYIPGQWTFVGEEFAATDKDLYTYPNVQESDTLWYHDHAIGATRLNVYAGLAGFYLLRDPLENALNLPSGNYEVGLAIQDRTFNPDGSLFYPAPPIVPEFFGDTMVVNGKVWPFLAVEPRKYRFRMLNGCNSRFLRMQLLQAVPGGTGVLMKNNAKKNIPGPIFNVIGTDGGFLPATAQVPIILIGPGERADVIVDFTGLAGQDFLLFNDAATPFSATPDTKGAIPEVMLFRVGATVTTPDTSTIPTTIRALPALPTYDPAGNGVLERNITLDEFTIKAGVISKLLEQRINMLRFMDPVTETPTAGTTEIWNIINLTVDTHPIHLHHSKFRLMERQGFNAIAYMTLRQAQVPAFPPPPVPTNLYVGAPIPVDPLGIETGYKDTIQANPGQITRIHIQWANHPNAPVSRVPGQPGNYVYHCHILEHEEHEMIRPLQISPPAAV